VRRRVPGSKKENSSAFLRKLERVKRHWALQARIISMG
jgi:hypothetical protein